MLTLIVGAQFGGEGKGKIGAYLGLKQNMMSSVVAVASIQVTQLSTKEKRGV